MFPFVKYLHLFPLQWVPWPLLAEALRFPTVTRTMVRKTAHPSVCDCLWFPLAVAFR